jgi:hypothetical protein
MTFRIKIILIFLFSTIHLFSQNRRADKEIDKLNCKRNNTLNPEELLKIFPYGISEKIILVSYQNHTPGIIGEDLQKQLDKFAGQKIDSAGLNRFKEIKILETPEIVKLADIIYNYGYKSEPTIYEAAKCYFPQNAILFIDKEGKLFSFIELCFGCSKFRTNIDKITLGEECSQKYDMIKEFFKENRILYGTVENAL